MVLYSGAGNKFVIFDGRSEDVSAYREAGNISRICSEHETDGLMILSESPDCDFVMEFFNPDGSGGMMCGNGGRCIVSFAASLGLKPSGSNETFLFAAPDGMHEAQILRREGARDIVRLKMKDVSSVQDLVDGYFLDTGTRHFVSFVPDVEAVDIEVEGPKARHDARFAPQGANANFVSVSGDGVLNVRTFEKGVEGETLACGTGITASAIAAAYHGILPPFAEGGRCIYPIRSRIDRLNVDFICAGQGTGFTATDVHLTGPAEQIG